MALGTRVQTRPVVFALSFRGKSWAAFGNEEAVSDKTILENRGLSTSYPGLLHVQIQDGGHTCFLSAHTR